MPGRPVVLTLAGWALALAGSTSHAAQPAAVPALRAVRVAGEARPVMDGRVDEAAWDAVEPHSEFVQQEPYELAGEARRRLLYCGQ
jgi:hypothetical protein